MADFVYGKALEHFAGGGTAIDWDADTIKVLGATSGYTANQSTHEFVSDIGAGNIVFRSGALASKTNTLGVLDAADVTITAVTGSVVTQLILYRDSGADGTSVLIAKMDSYTGLPYTPNGSDVTVVWPNDANKILKI